MRTDDPVSPQHDRTKSVGATPRSDVGAQLAAGDLTAERCDAAGRMHYDRAIFYVGQGDASEAIAAYEQAVKFAPDFAEAHSNLGNLYLKSGRHADALRAYSAAIRAKPDLAPLYCNLAAVLIDLERYDEAIATCDTAIHLAPDLFEAYENLCHAYRRSGRTREALAPALRAIDLRPDAAAYVYLGVVAFNLDDLEIALAAYRRALEQDPSCVKTRCNLGAVYHLTGQYAQSIEACTAALALQPDFAGAHLNLALSLLICGDFPRGWEEYLWAWRVPAKRARYPYLDRMPLWNGEEFAGRRLVVTPDQGFGDAIQMARFLPAIKARGGHVILEVRSPLVALFADLAGVDELRVHADDAPLAQVDLHVPILGLPRALGTDLGSIPAEIPYLWAQPERLERWCPRLRSAAPVRVGIAWAGSPGNANDRHRSVRLEEFAALGGIEGIAWFGLQKGRDEDVRSCGSFTIDPLGAQIGDFADTAAIIAQLDLVIAVDSSVVHLAGALGVPVWTVLPFAPDWRWLLERDDSPWYPTMRLFRQPVAGDWASVFARVAQELRAFKPSYSRRERPLKRRSLHTCPAGPQATACRSARPRAQPN